MMNVIKNKQKNISNSFWLAVLTLWAIILMILIGLTEDVVNSESIINFDKYFNNIFASWRSGWGVSIFSGLTYLGNWQIILPVALLIIAILIIKQKKTFVLPFLFTIISSATVTFIGKILIHRFRPVGAVIIESDFSFPSGHATVAIAFYGFLAYLLTRLIKNNIKRQLILAVAIVIIITIGFSRLYLGVHYVSDVLAGYLVGALALISGISLHLKSNQK